MKMADPSRASAGGLEGGGSDLTAELSEDAALPGAEAMHTLLVLRRFSEAIAASARCLNSLACPGCENDSTSGTTLVPPLLTLPSDARLIKLSIKPMLVLLQCLCELGKPELSLDVVQSFYMVVPAVPFPVTWVALQAMARAGQPEAVAQIALDWLGTEPTNCGASAQQQLMRLAIHELSRFDRTHVHAFVSECRARCHSAEEADQLSEAVAPLQVACGKAPQREATAALDCSSDSLPDRAALSVARKHSWEKGGPHPVGSEGPRRVLRFSFPQLFGHSWHQLAAMLESAPYVAQVLRSPLLILVAVTLASALMMARACRTRRGAGRSSAPGGSRLPAKLWQDTTRLLQLLAFSPRGSST